eukprot:2842025-Pyramimonas_sp.AAC.1
MASNSRVSAQVAVARDESSSGQRPSRLRSQLALQGHRRGEHLGLVPNNNGQALVPQHGHDACDEL